VRSSPVGDAQVILNYEYSDCRYKELFTGFVTQSITWTTDYVHYLQNSFIVELNNITHKARRDRLTVRWNLALVTILVHRNIQNSLND